MFSEIFKTLSSLLQDIIIMPRVYKPKFGAKTYKKYDHLIIEKALAELGNENVSLKYASNKYGISKTELHRHNTRNVKSQGGQTALSLETENLIVTNLNVCAEWGYPLDTTDLGYIVKMYLDSNKIFHTRFKNNYPGKDFVEGFLRRHKDKISSRICQNVKRSREAVSQQLLKNILKSSKNL